jgi:NAD(P)-dependent dehydrogenase (short-subunit alcohol dehydrogenase family)
MKDKICLVTGANAGIGKVTALELAKMGATVVIVCRDKNRGEEALKEIKEQSKNDNVELLLADLSSQKDIHKLAAEFKSKYNRLDVLVNNAGVIFGERRITVDGIENTFALNHLGYFLLANLLLDVLKASSPARIINVSSEGHRMGNLKYDDLNREKGYNSLQVYGQTKLDNIIFTNELARRLEGTGVTVNSLHPGGVATNFGSGNNTFFGFLVKLARPFLITAEKGAQTTVYLASSPKVEGITGKYFVRKKIAKPSKISQDLEAGKRLWEISEKMTSLVTSNV